MADTLKNEGKRVHVPFVVETGTTITAGSMIWADISGTDIIHPVTSLANSTGFVGVIAETLTGPHTGVVIGTEGVYKFIAGDSTTHGATGVPIEAGGQAFAVGHDTIRGLGTTAATLTGHYPVGEVVFFPMTGYASGATSDVWVKIFPSKQLEPLT